MKQVQSVLWCAMVKISSTYSVKEFEDDFKHNLAKCALRMKETNADEHVDEADVSMVDEQLEVLELKSVLKKSSYSN